MELNEISAVIWRPCWRCLRNGGMQTPAVAALSIRPISVHVKRRSFRVNRRWPPVSIMFQFRSGILAGFLQDSCRILAGFLQDSCRILAGFFLVLGSNRSEAAWIGAWIFYEILWDSPGFLEEIFEILHVTGVPAGKLWDSPLDAWQIFIKLMPAPRLGR